MGGALLLTLSLATAGWGDTFNNPATADALGIVGKRVIIAAPGLDDEGRLAARALRKSVKGKVQVLLDEGSLPGAYDDDESFLRGSKGLPVDRWVSVRVFPSDDGLLAVVTSYTKKGDTQALSGQKGRPLDLPEIEGRMSDEVVDSVSDVVSENVESAQERIDEYEKRFLWIGTGIGADQYRVYTYDVVYQGKYKKTITNQQMYALFDDEKLLQRVEEAQAGWEMATWWLTGATVLSTAAAVGGFTMFALDTGNNFTGLIAGTLCGTIAMSIGWTPCLTCVQANNDDLAVLTAEELREYVDVYNKSLRKSLSLENVQGLPRGYSAMPSQPMSF